MALITDFHKVCLICLLECDGMLSIVDPDLQTSGLTIMEKISQCSDLGADLRSDTKLPDKICPQCVDDLEGAWRFRTNCDNANTIYRNLEQQAEEMAFENEMAKVISAAKRRHKKRKVTKKIYTAPAEKQDSGGEGEGEAAPGHTEQVEMFETEPSGEPVNDDEDDNDEFVELEVETCDSSQYELLPDDEIADTNERQPDELPTDEEHVMEEHEDGTDEPPPPPIVTNDKLPKTKENANYAGLNGSYEDFLSKREPTPVKRGRGRPKKSERAEQTEPVKKLPLALTRTKAVRTERVTREPKICEICGNTYKFQHALLAHMRRHNNERPYTCEFCSKGFVSNVELKRHMRTHTGHKPYGCQYCERRFADFGSRRKHERTHTGERPYACDTCGKSFAYAHVLTVHQRTHTGEKRFKCEICQRGFTKKLYLDAHLVMHRRVSAGQLQNAADYDELAAQQLEQLMAARAKHQATQHVDDDGDGDEEEVEEEIVKEEEVEEDGQFIDCDQSSLGEDIDNVAVAEECVFTTDMTQVQAEDDDGKDEDIYEIYTLNGQIVEGDGDADNRYTMVMT